MDYIFSKPYHLTFSYHLDYLEAEVVGFEDSLEVSCSYWQEIAAEVRRGGFDKVLVVERIVGNVDPADAFEIARRNAATDFRGAKIAFVDAYEDHRDINRLCETVSNNRGRNIRCCESVLAAAKWLRSH